MVSLPTGPDNSGNDEIRSTQALDSSPSSTKLTPGSFPSPSLEHKNEAARQNLDMYYYALDEIVRKDPDSTEAEVAKILKADLQKQFEEKIVQPANKTQGKNAPGITAQEMKAFVKTTLADIAPTPEEANQESEAIVNKAIEHVRKELSQVEETMSETADGKRSVRLTRGGTKARAATKHTNLEGGAVGKVGNEVRNPSAKKAQTEVAGTENIESQAPKERPNKILRPVDKRQEKEKLARLSEEEKDLVLKYAPKAGPGTKVSLEHNGEVAVWTIVENVEEEEDWLGEKEPVYYVLLKKNPDDEDEEPQKELAGVVKSAILSEALHDAKLKKGQGVDILADIEAKTGGFEVGEIIRLKPGGKDWEIRKINTQQQVAILKGVEDDKFAVLKTKELRERVNDVVKAEGLELKAVKKRFANPPVGELINIFKRPSEDSNDQYAATQDRYNQFVAWKKRWVDSEEIDNLRSKNGNIKITPEQIASTKKIIELYSQLWEASLAGKVVTGGIIQELKGNLVNAARILSGRQHKDANDFETLISSYRPESDAALITKLEGVLAEANKVTPSSDLHSLSTSEITESVSKDAALEKELLDVRKSSFIKREQEIMSGLMTYKTIAERELTSTDGSLSERMAAVSKILKEIKERRLGFESLSVMEDLRNKWNHYDNLFLNMTDADLEKFDNEKREAIKKFKEEEKNIATRLNELKMVGSRICQEVEQRAETLMRKLLEQKQAEDTTAPTSVTATPEIKQDPATRNAEIIRRYKAGEDMPEEKLLSEGYTKEDAAKMLKLLTLIKR